MPRSHRILVVDDDSAICANLADILSDLGYDVDTASDGWQALEHVRSKHFDLAMLDFRMPGMDGLELYRRIKAMSGSTVAIVITAYANVETTAAAAIAGVWQLLPKPVNLDHLLSQVTKALDQPLVIVVDDDSELCANLSDILRGRGYRVSSASSADEAEQILGDQEFQLALVDLKLPSRDGVEVLRHIRGRHPTTKCVVVTGHRSEMQERLEQAQTEGADAICYKPFNMGELIDLVRKFAPPNHVDPHPASVP